MLYISQKSLVSRVHSGILTAFANWRKETTEVRIKITDKNSVEPETENAKDALELKPKRETPTSKFISVCKSAIQCEV